MLAAYVQAGENLTITTLASNPAANFNDIRGAAVDSAGNIYVADVGRDQILMIGPGGGVSVLAGSGVSDLVDGTAMNAAFASPRGVAVDSSGSVYVADVTNKAVRKIAQGMVTTLANNVDFPASNSVGMAVDNSGTLYVPNGFTVLKITTQGGVVTMLNDSTGTPFNFTNATAVALDNSGNVYVADTNVSTIFKFTMPSGAVSTVMSGPTFVSTHTVAVDGSGNVYSEGSDTIVKITPAGALTTLAGNFATGGTTDGTGTIARFSTITGLVADSSGNLYITDFDAVRKGTLNQSATTPATVTSISPSSVAAGGGAFTLSVTGTNFTATTGVQVGSPLRPTTFVSATSLTVAVTAADIATVGTVYINVEDQGTISAVPLKVNTASGGTLTLASPATSSLNPSNVGDTVTFTASATDSSGATPSYTWDFGDGSATVSGASVTHMFAAQGFYTVTVMASNGTTSISSSVAQIVNVAGMASITVSKAMAKFNLKTPGASISDMLTLTGTIPLPASFNPTGVKAVFKIGALLTKSFTLNDKGMDMTDKNNTFKLTGKIKSGVFTVTTALFTLKLKKQDLFTGLTSYGVVNNTIKKPGSTVTVPIGVSLGANSFAAPINLNYTSTMGKTGTAKFP